MAYIYSKDRSEEPIYMADSEINPNSTKPDEEFPRFRTVPTTAHLGQSIVNPLKAPKNSPKLPRPRIWMPYNRNPDLTQPPVFAVTNYRYSVYLRDPNGNYITDSAGRPREFVDSVALDPYVATTEWELARIERILESSPNLDGQGFWLSPEEVTFYLATKNGLQKGVQLRTGIWGAQNFKRQGLV